MRVRRRGRAGWLIPLVASALVLLAVPTAAPTSASDFVNGNAFADASVLRIAPGVGGLGLATTAGVAVSEIKNQLAQSEAKTADLGLIGSTLTAPSCSGAPGALKPDQLPQPTRVDNRHGDAAAGSDEVPIAGSALGGGRESAKATKQPRADAVVTTTAFAADPLVRINGGQAQATTQIIDNKAREARASVDVNLDLAGAVQLHGLRWEAVHRTGAGPDVHGGFTIDGASAGGVPIPINLDQLRPVQDAVNKAIAYTGMRIELPTVLRIKEPADLVRVSPLRIIIQDTPLGADALRPPLSLTRPQKEQLFTQIGTTLCQLAGAVLVGDIALSIAAGTGFLAIDVGGAEATTAEIIYTNPFGTDLPLPNLNIPGIPEVPADTFALPTQNGNGTLTRPVLTAGPVERVCESTHKFRWPSCSQGAAGLLGVLGVLATVGVGVLDWRHQRKKLAAKA